jgi:hypothetical protein
MGSDNFNEAPCSGIRCGDPENDDDGRLLRGGSLKERSAVLEI